MTRRRAAAIITPLVVLVVAAATFYLTLDTGTYLGRWFKWRASDVGDMRRFPHHDVETAPPVFTFPRRPTPAVLDTITLAHDGTRRRIALDDLVASTSTTAFVVIADDTVVVERYGEGAGPASMVTSFSVAKSITALLVGIAIGEGAIDGTDDPVTRYVPELAARDSRFEHVTVGHLLSMRSGIAFRDHDLPWGDKARVYYDPHLRERLLELDVAAPPGERFVYNSYNTVLLGLVLERATGLPPSVYLETRLWRPLGMAYDASWSIDSEAGQMVKMESGVNARAIDLAKIGRLLLTDGRWRGEQVVPRSWIARSRAVVPEHRVPGIGDGIHYQLGWWIHAPTDRQRYAVEAWGHLGQYISVFPDEDLIIVRFGEEPGGVVWPRVFQAIAGAWAQGR